MVDKMTSSEASNKAFVSARLRAMLEDVERWPVPQSLLQALDACDPLCRGDAAEPKGRPAQASLPAS